MSEPVNEPVNEPAHASVHESAHESADAAKEGAVTEPPRRAPRSELRIQHQPGFVLHAYPYRETSLIVDVLTRDHGRLALVAKGAKRPHSALRGVLQTFQPLLLSWTGRAELRTLTKAEWVGGMLPLAGEALISGFYLNELLIKFCAREDPHPVLFAQYTETLARLGQGDRAAFALRSFERVLLQETGYAVRFDRCANRALVEPDGEYVYDPEQGVRLAAQDAPAAWPVVKGQTLLDMTANDFSRPVSATQSRMLMRFLLDYYLNGAVLKTRQILIDLHNL
ncbi:DNA repair protein RecO [Imbroritus primus]|uniref:DNA repair protein RecO n=1 Tax=Imbroritus primus TaxID=3058603 RepID=UPI003D161235